MRSNPSTEVLGYSQSSRFAGLYSDFYAKPLSGEHFGSAKNS